MTSRLNALSHLSILLKFYFQNVLPTIYKYSIQICFFSVSLQMFNLSFFFPHICSSSIWRVPFHPLVGHWKDFLCWFLSRFSIWLFLWCRDTLNWFMYHDVSQMANMCSCQHKFQFLLFFFKLKNWFWYEIICFLHVFVPKNSGNHREILEELVKCENAF